MTDKPEETAAPAEAPEDVDQTERRSLYRHPLAAVGGAIVAAGFFSFVVLVAIDITSPSENPYRNIITFMALPILITIGIAVFLVAVRIQIGRARKRGEKVRFMLRVEPSDPKYMRNLWLFLGLTAVFLTIVAWGGLKGYETTDSISFCGEACHVMEPQNVTFHNSPHARVACAECHIGPGTSFWVRSKIDGLRQVWAVATNSYESPIPTPVESLRPAPETCEECHWPDQFYGQKLVNINYYRTDEANSPWTVSLLVNVGGGNPRTGELEGVHWHILGGNEIEYIATDEKRQDIAWVRYTDQETGFVFEYMNPNKPIDPTDEQYEIRHFDCLDCHNRPSHIFQPPATAINLEIGTGNISQDLPYIRTVGLDLLNAEYAEKAEALNAIKDGVTSYYATDYPEVSAAMPLEIGSAVAALQRIYSNNFFPEFKTDYRARENNLSHFVNEGCFRCHESGMQSAQGKPIPADCDTCHAIVAQGPTDDLDELEDNLGGLEFIHPADIGGVWQTVRCTQCHNPSQGY